MQHIQEILNAKRINKEKILASPVSISIKYDGTALQYSKGNFYKRPYKPSVVLENKIVTKFDLALNDFYNIPIEYLQSADIDSVCKNYDVVNFELISENNTHTFKYSNNAFKNGIILLSAYKNGNEVNFYELKKIAKLLNVSLVEQIVENQTLESIGITYQMLNDNKDDIVSLFEIFYKRLRNINSIDDNNLEGFVITIYDEDAQKVRKYKIINPSFTQAFYANKEKNIEDRSNISFENLCTTFNTCFSLIPYSWIKYINGISDDFEKRIALFNRFIKNDNVREAFKDAFLDDKLKNGTVFIDINLNKQWIKEHYPKYYDFINYISRRDNAAIAFLFLVIYKRTHKNNIFNVKTETNNEINSYIERIFS